MSCGPSYHLKRAKKHLLLAESKGANITTDTLYKDVKFKVPAIKVQFEPKVFTQKDTVYFETKVPGAAQPAKLKIVIQHDTIKYTEVICPEREQTETVPVSTSTNISSTSGIKWYWLFLLFAIGYIVRALWTK